MRGGKPIEVIERWMREAADRDYYDKIYTLQLYMSGDSDAMAAAIQGRALGTAWSRTGDFLPEYGEIVTKINSDGFAFHGMVNSRINVQGLTMEPELIVAHPDPVLREYVAAFFRHRWENLRWQDHFYATGMEVECGGVGHCEVGLTQQRLDVRHAPVLDTLWDRSARLPAQWRWYAFRDRMTPEKAKETYSCLTKDDIDKLTNEEAPRSNQGQSSTSVGVPRCGMKLVTEWRYWDGEDHLVMLGKSGSETRIYLRLNDKNEYVKVDAKGRAGANPFGAVPAASWVDSWAPGVNRPVGKSQTTIRIAVLLNEVEQYMMETLRNGVPITGIDVLKVKDKAFVERVKNAKSWRGLQKVIPLNGSIRDVISRLEPAALTNVVVVLRAALKEELNAATGTMDMMRGNALQGERTKAEIDSLNNNAGIQAQHMRRQFARFLEDMIRVGRVVASQYDRAKTTLVLPSFGSYDTAKYPIRPFLEEDAPITVNPNSLVYKTEQDRKNEAIMEFQQLHLPYINLGAIDKRKSLAVIGRKYGYRDALSELGIDLAPETSAMPQQPQMPQAPVAA